MKRKTMEGMVSGILGRSKNISRAKIREKSMPQQNYETLYRRQPYSAGNRLYLFERSNEVSYFTPTTVECQIFLYLILSMNICCFRWSLRGGNVKMPKKFNIFLLMIYVCSSAAGKYSFILYLLYFTLPNLLN